MSLQNIALISLSDAISASELANTASALQKQIIRDIGPAWGIGATISAFPSLDSMPVGYWPITISNAEMIDQVNDEGYHWSDEANIPFAIVKHDDSWQLTCSHEMCEMLVDPYGNRTVTSDSILSGQGRVSYLVEVCDPCEDAQFAYTVNGITVSDFYTPQYFDPVRNGATRYSYTGAVSAPRQVLHGGYLTWNNPADGRWFQATFFDDNIEFEDITEKMQGRPGPVRSRVDRITKNVDKLISFNTGMVRRAMTRPAFDRSEKGFQAVVKKQLSQFIKL